MQVICIANRKGGIGKTSTATTLTSILNEKGFKTLLIDADPQCNTSDTYRAKYKDTATLYDVILDFEDPLPISEAIQKTEIGDIIAGDEAMDEEESRNLFPETANRYFLLRNALKDLVGYDFVIIDTGPASSALTMNCLVAADKVIIPVQPRRHSIQGLSTLNRKINLIRAKYNPNLKVEGILIVQYDKNEGLSIETKETLEEIATKLNTKVFSSMIRSSSYKLMGEAQANRTTINKYSPRCAASVDYRALAEELLKGDSNAENKNTQTNNT